MNRYLTTVFLGLATLGAVAGPSPAITPEYYNYGYLTTTPTVDAVSFYNAGDFIINAVVAATPTNLTHGLLEGSFNPLPFSTKDTLYFTNTVSGLMQAYPGFLFDTVTSTSRQSASYFVNQGTVQGLDVQALALDAIYSPPGSTETTIVPALGQPIPSELYVQATNIINTGALAVGNAGTLSLTGSNVSSVFGTLQAGVVGTVGPDNAAYNSTGLQGQNGSELYEGGPYYYVPSLGVYDLFWGVTNALTTDVGELSAELESLATDTPDYVVPSIAVNSRGSSIEPAAFPLNFVSGKWSVTAIFYTNNVTNFYYNIVFVNTNFVNTNVTATVGFSSADFLQYDVPATPADGNAVEDLVQIAEPVYDVITGQTETNGIYVIDDGAYLPTMSLSQNASEAGPYSRPNAFALTTSTPLDWYGSTTTAAEYAVAYDEAAIYSAGIFNNNMEGLEISEYGAQIGHNPQDYFGSFSSLTDTNSLDYDDLNFLIVNLPDPTNEPGRIEITANNLNLSQARARAEGIVNLNVTNLVGLGTAAVDFGEANVSLGVSASSLVVSNLFPSTFERIRGDIYAWSATWQNTETNDGVESVTNQWHYHVLIVDQNLFGSFTPTIRNLTLTGSNSIVLQDPLNVISSVQFNTTNLTLQSSNFFGQNAENFGLTNTPFMKNLFINTNGVLGSGNILDIGFNQNQGQAAPGGRTYTVNSITNFGSMFSIAPLLQAAVFENDGHVTASSGGSILIEASNLSMGLALPNVTNTLIADGSIDLSAVTIEARNSVISNGLAEPASLTLTATAELTDLVSGTPTTNTNSVIINHWTVNNGFSMPVKPVMGDLYGTEIHTIASGVEYVTHTWAATDWSNNIAKGFNDNEVIGRLVLDRTSSNSTLHFSAAGVKNAMYVDYLELTNYAYTNYSKGISIDPNFTIYFADSNFDPQKLQQIYPNLVWVTNFVGPNSVQVVPYTNSSIVCLMNAGVAHSGTISFWDSYPNQTFLNMFGPYLLNGIYGTNFMDCPGNYAYPCNCTPGTNSYQLTYINNSAGGGASNLLLLTVAYNGEGSISPELTTNQLVKGNSYTLKATPATGWTFDSWSTAMLGNVITSYSNVLTFAFVTNTVVTANFIPIPFPSLAGSYNGLFYRTNGVEPNSSGSISLTLTKSGGASGKLVIGSTNYSFSTQFSGAGSAQFTTKSGAESLTVNLQLDITNQSAGQIFGEVSNVSWNAVLLANLAPTWTTKNPSPLAGSYTMSLPWEAGTVATPGGDSYGAGTISKLGVLTLAGSLSDGAAFSESAPVSSGGLWPFYIYSASGKDSVLGWVTVSNGLGSPSVTWSKPAGKGPLYLNGFTNVLQMIGSTWAAPTKTSVLLSLTNPVIVLSGGNLTTSPLTLTVSSQNALTYSATNADVSIKSSTGVFTGWFEQPKSAKKVTISGVVLTNANSARGYFLGTNESGAALLESQ